MIVTLSEKLKELRMEKGMKQDEFAQLLDVSREVYNYYETGRRAPSIYAIISLCQKLNISSDYLLGLSETKNVAYSNIAKTTGLSEPAIDYLADVNDVAKDHSSTDNKKKIINALLEDAQGLEIIRQKIEFEKNMWKPDFENPYMKSNYAVFEEIEFLWDRYDYCNTPEGQAELEQHEQYFREFVNNPEYASMLQTKSEKETRKHQFYINDKNKVHLLDKIISYVLYDTENVYLKGMNSQEQLTNAHSIRIGFGNMYLEFPSKESKEIIDYALIQDIISALKDFKKSYHK